MLAKAHMLLADTIWSTRFCGQVQTYKHFLFSLALFIYIRYILSPIHIKNNYLNTHLVTNTQSEHSMLCDCYYSNNLLVFLMLICSIFRLFCAVKRYQFAKIEVTCSLLTKLCFIPASLAAILLTSWLANTSSTSEDNVLQLSTSYNSTRQQNQQPLRQQQNTIKCIEKKITRYILGAQQIFQDLNS